MNDRTEATRIAYEETPPHRNDRTPGDWPIPQSPFKTTAALAEAMSKYTSKPWEASTEYLGGRGYSPCLVSTDDIQYSAPSRECIVYIWRDASGGWHPEHKVGANWLPNLDLLDELIEASRQAFDNESACGNFTQAEVDYMRHPD